jgi:hypothetical protein
VIRRVLIGSGLVLLTGVVWLGFSVPPEDKGEGRSMSDGKPASGIVYKITPRR